MEKKIGKREIIFLFIIFAVIVAVWLGYHMVDRQMGNEIRITVDGDEYGIYSLNEEQEIPIEINGESHNTLIISGGKADMTDADCPDQLCVNMKAISAEGETIVCLPHKIVVEVISSEKEKEFDTIAN